VDRVEGVDWDSVLGHVVVLGLPLTELEDSLPDGGVEESHADCCDVPVAAGLDGGQAVGYLHEPLEGLEESAEEHARGETACSDEDFDDA
jgi:hypothetical protein